MYYASGGTTALIVKLGVTITASGAALCAAAVAAKAAGATAASAIATTNIWNPAGWAVGDVAVGASHNTPQTMTWGCYKPIIGEIDTRDTSIEPFLLEDLAAHPKVRQVSISEIAGSANLPDVQVENEAGEHFLLRGVALPWGSVAYHAERSFE